MGDEVIACSLSVGELEAVRARYAEAARGYEASVAYEGDAARVALRGDKASLAALLDEMIAREGACCSFLHFDVVESPEGYQVPLTIPNARGMEQAILRELVPTLFPHP